jgi:hypothetical protein
MTIADLMEKLALLYPRKYAGDAGGVWFEAFKAALGHCQGEKLESAWHRYMAEGLRGHPPSPSELRDLLPEARSMVTRSASSSYMDQLRAARDEEATEARAWLMTWWQPLIAKADAAGDPNVARAIRYQANTACRRRDLAVAEAWRRDLKPALCDAENYATAMWSAQKRCGIRSNDIPWTALPGDAIGMWRALHGGKNAMEQAA